ncbi:hypothetical protein AB434_0347 [Heyndrickxia coagulans]|uniref:Uncharacterized protein n=1 Tax=Heyndrickxia coagulans TaxID=1398 RepID=A0AAN0T624_HEYCO|nr:hypothetical protein SB48_HM08orf01292 [Heyndrickxia coagulans]AKN52752.1 hypothetical protein AB434_0347 [Heyndrickxia coagulans]APB37154.1 hypothetical protein BIZ35_10340 [Heyndrickxia coagulans]ATW82160.1 hypothetical protein CIW84_03615 [Heyndrickxia coagulans]AVD57177.1 hypothetical protein C3766_14345 [Heyndrickxia coagulans]
MAFLLFGAHLFILSFCFTFIIQVYNNNETVSPFSFGDIICQHYTKQDINQNSMNQIGAFDLELEQGTNRYICESGLF